MNTRPQEPDSDLFLDELEYLRGPVQGLYKTAKNARKYIISGLNSIDEQLKPITYASFNNDLNDENGIQYIDHWIAYLQKMKQEIKRFQNLSDFEQNALKTRIDFINQKYNQLQRENKTNKIESYQDQYPLYHFPYSKNDKNIINSTINDEIKEESEENKERKYNDNDNDDNLMMIDNNNNNKNNNNKRIEDERVYGINKSDRHYRSIWIDRLLIDYLSRNQYFKTAYALVEDTDLTILTNIRLYHKIREPLDGLETRNPHSIIKWCRANKTLLKQHQVSYVTFI